MGSDIWILLIGLLKKSDLGEAFGQEASDTVTKLRRCWVGLAVFVGLCPLPLIFLGWLFRTENGMNSSLLAHDGALLVLLGAILFIRLYLILVDLIVRQLQVLNYVRGIGALKPPQEVNQWIAQLESVSGPPTPEFTVTSDSLANMVVLSEPISLTDPMESDSQAQVALGGGLFHIGLTPEETGALLAFGIARSSLRMQSDPKTASAVFSILPAGFALMMLVLAAVAHWSFWFFLAYVILSITLAFLFLRFSTVICDYTFLLSDSMAVKLTGDAAPLAAAIQKISEAANSNPTGKLESKVGGYLFVPTPFFQFLRFRRAPGVPREAAMLLKQTDDLTTARLANLDMNAHGVWPVFRHKGNVSATATEDQKNIPQFKRLSTTGPAAVGWEPSPEPGMVTCGRCGAENVAGAGFCSLCLAPFTDAAEKDITSN